VVLPEEGDRLLHEQPLVWATHRNGHRDKERPLRLAVTSVDCPWRLAALDALKRAGIPYRIAYLSNVSESQLAAVRADLAVAALPLSRVTSCNRPVCVNEDLPKLPYTQIVLRTSVNPGETPKHWRYKCSRPLTGHLRQTGQYCGFAIQGL
jgi:DNA-binding transcriptional LysR family regulator